MLHPPTSASLSRSNDIAPTATLPPTSASLPSHSALITRHMKRLSPVKESTEMSHNPKSAADCRRAARSFGTSIALPRDGTRRSAKVASHGGGGNGVPEGAAPFTTSSVFVLSMTRSVRGTFLVSHSWPYTSVVQVVLEHDGAPGLSRTTVSASSPTPSVIPTSLGTPCVGFRKTSESGAS